MWNTTKKATYMPSRGLLIAVTRRSDAVLATAPFRDAAVALTELNRLPALTSPRAKVAPSRKAMQTAFCRVSSQDTSGYETLNGLLGAPFACTGAVVLGAVAGSEGIVRVDMMMSTEGVVWQKQEGEQVKLQTMR